MMMHEYSLHVRLDERNSSQSWQYWITKRCSRQHDVISHGTIGSPGEPLTIARLVRLVPELCSAYGFRDATWTIYSRNGMISFATIIWLVRDE